MSKDKVEQDANKLQNIVKKNRGLDPARWFTRGKKPVFVPYQCAEEYRKVYPSTVTEYKGTIHQFTGKYYLKDAGGTIRTTIENAGAGRIKPRQINEAVESLTNLTRIIDPNKIDLPMEKIMPLPDHVIPIEDGLFNLMTREITPHSPKYFYTEFLPRHYIAGAEPIFFNGFMDSLFKDDPDAQLKKRQIFDTIAWTLMNNYNIQGAVIFFGQGGEGKSIIHSVIGDLLVNVTSLTLQELENDKFKRAELYGSWANLISESSTEIITSEWFKRLTDGTVITVDRKNGHPFQMASHAKLIMDVNELPKRETELRAFYRRVIAIIDFPNLLEDVLKPAQINDFVQKMKDTEELDRIFSYAVDHHYEQIASSLKFTGGLSLAEAETKWEERSNPAKSYLKMKKEAGEILTDVDSVLEILQGNKEKISRYIAKESSGEEYLAMIKNDVIADAVKWATSKGFPAKTINGKTLGSALVAMGFPNETVSKKAGKASPLKAWKDIYVQISRNQIPDVSSGPLKLPQPQEKPSQVHGTQFGNGSLPFSPDEREEHESKVGKIGEIRYPTANSLYTAEKKPVTGNLHDPLPDMSPPGAGNKIVNKDEPLSREFTTAELENYRVFISYILEYAEPVNEIDNVARNLTIKFEISANDFNSTILPYITDSKLAVINGKHLDKIVDDYTTIYRKTKKSIDINTLRSSLADLYIKMSEPFIVNSLTYLALRVPKTENFESSKSWVQFIAISEEATEKEFLTMKEGAKQ